jgi:membrane associated rhomboid family serine protease
MGIHDREYYREEPRGIFLGGDRSMVVNLVIINVIVFLADILLFNDELGKWIGLQPSLFREPWNAWQLWTYGFVHDPHSIMHVGFNMLFLWFLGRDIETIYGKRAFLQLYLTLVIVSGFCWVVSENLLFRRYDGPPVVGASGAVFGVMLVFVLHYPTRIFYVWGVLPIPVWLLAGLYVLNDFTTISRSARDGVDYDHIAHAAHLAGAAYGALFYKTRWTLFSLVPTKLVKRGFKARPKLKLHSPEEDDRLLSQRVDAILEKISREGEASLTKEERRTLEDASRRYQRRRT